MYHNALIIVEEYLRSTNAQIRKNAVSALAVIGEDSEAINRLVTIALSDDEESVRSRAEEEIASLKEKELEQAIKRLQRALDYEENQMRAYIILGRLKSKGIAVSVSGKSWMTRIRLAWRLHSLEYPGRNWGFRMRAWVPSLSGGLIGLGLLAVFLVSIANLHFSDGGSYIASAFGLLILSTLTGVIASQRATPIRIYLDRTVGFVVETTSAIFWGILGTIILLLLYNFFNTRRGYSIEGYRYPTDSFLDSYMLGYTVISALILGSLTGIVRAGTLLAYGSFPNKKLTRFFQFSVGPSLISWIIIGFALIVRSSTYDISGMRGFAAKLISFSDDFDLIWIFLLPLSFATANAFATIDNEKEELWPTSRTRKILCVAIVLPIFILALLVLAGPRRA